MNPALPALLSLLLAASAVAGGVPGAPGPDGDPVAEGLRLYRAGKYAEAVGAFREALEDDPDDPRLNYNLALACWRAGEFDAAETAAEKAAALSKGRFDARRDGILGSLRYDRARQLAAAAEDPKTELQQLEQARDLARQARTHFQRGALGSTGGAPGAGSAAVLWRNLERTIRFERELDERIEAAKKRQEEQKQKDQQDDKDKDKDNKDQQDQKKSDQKQDPDQKPDPQQDPDEKPEPDPKQDQDQDQKPPDAEEQPDDKQPKEPPKPQAAPGEHDPDKELTPEQRRQLLKRLQEFEEALQKLKEARRAQRPKVKKDW